VDELYPGGIMIGAVEYDMLPCIMSRPVGGGQTWARGDVFGAQPKTVRIVRVEAVCNGKAEEGRGDEMVAPCIPGGGLLPSGGVQAMWEGWLEGV
jgi:hypothetical protein